MTQSRLALTLDLSLEGRQTGDLMLRWSDNSNPLGYHPIPIISIKGGDGPTVLITGGTHGDEYEGPAAIMRLAQSLHPDTLAGQVILIPALNAPALYASARVSPLDGQNLNRAFPGDADGGPTAMIAHFIETELLPKCDALIDLHSGGKASFFQPCALATHTNDKDLYQANMALARAFGLPLIWRLGSHNDNRSVNAAGERAGIATIATELGGGGGVDPGITDATELGLRRCLAHIGMLPEASEPAQARVIELNADTPSIFAPSRGVFDRFVSAGTELQAGDRVGTFHFIEEPERPSIPVIAQSSGYVLAHTCRGLVQRGDLLILVATDADE